ncbi:Plexin-B [Folsomia candida]|uniref:Plexin-B n=1 Tax=Folsomia candida TaxID=158441 RepID=A0A226E6F5_FOLCA|nr:Plexin-B [Folsomia candida]
MWIPTPFLLIDIEAKFTENIHMCFNGSVENRNMDYISGPILDGKCYEPGAAGNIPDFCDVGLKISGAIPIVRTAAIRFQDVLLSSIALASTEQHTVAFAGTSQGVIKKFQSKLRSSYILIRYDDDDDDFAS